MNLIDLHCDTPAELFSAQCGLIENNLHVDLQKISRFENYLQSAAFFTSPHFSDAEGLDRVRDYYHWLEKVTVESGKATVVKTLSEIKSAFGEGKAAFLPAVEDLRILNNNLAPLDELKKMGIFFATPLWSGKTCIGGAWNTDEGLTDFGKSAVEKLLFLGMTPDVSHSSVKSFYDMLAICKKANKPLVATHSCARTLRDHGRNLYDEQAKEIANVGGLIGINFYPVFLHPETKADIPLLVDHILHLQKVAGSDTVAIGSDFDGVECLPKGLQSAADLPLIADELQKRGVGTEVVDRLFYKNAYRFLNAHLA